MKKFNFIILYLFTPFICAQDHLYPLEYLYDNDAFKPAFSMYVDLKVIINQPFTPASVLYITEVNNKSSLIYLKLPKVLHNNTPSKAEELCNISIDNNLAEKIEKIWKSELYKTHYPQKLQETRDGTTYSFSIPSRVYEDKNGWNSQPKMLGYAWSPKPSTRMGSFVKLVDSLKEFCLKENSLVNLNKAINKLYEQ